MPKMPVNAPSKPALISKTQQPVTVDLANASWRVRTLKPEAVTPTIARWLTDPAVMEGLNAPKQSMGLDAFRAYVESFDNVRRNIMVILERPEDRPVGLAILELDLRHRTGSLHLVIGSQSDRGNNIAYRASALVVYHAFIDREVEKMTFQPLERNEAAIAASEKSGLKLEGILRKHRIDARTGERLDQRVYGLTADEFRQRLAEHLSSGKPRPSNPSQG